ncbi:uncharacterized protein LACBIDRAFT_315841 [Laccaria bicolor S238N-H82]|uniref:Predicted protein n=1 Tax=Laccaria bicolor (strain S238N-H82 / ATCC MYA-4686) TaxID=486041 RepID=B0D3B4_LACBS|nr:uncharacterized protein LACBIDRAFT_315841 [Laccaria bicolor S238N-H82]EDR10886.1 predicted protein [Laccaria bicolor S238N-H82]|eukprot:XP_001878187.1 predicted protein [Laccaria bicolor S238N-H82]
MDSVRKRKLDSTNDNDSGKKPRMTEGPASAGPSAVPTVQFAETAEASVVAELASVKGKGKAEENAPGRAISNMDSVRKRTNDNDSGKRTKMTEVPASAGPSVVPEVQLETSAAAKGKTKEIVANAPDRASRPRINKLAPPRPFPTVPKSVSATGPRSAHKEGKNFLCLSRKTSLGTYMRRCKDVIIKDGYKTLHLSAMGAAIPLLLQLTCALPPILPFPKDEIHTEVITGTVNVQDEVIPEDDEEDITYQTRGKSTVKVIFRIGDGEFEGDRTGPLRKYSKGGGGKNKNGSGGKDNDVGKQKDQGSSAVVFQEPEQEDFMDML